MYKLKSGYRMIVNNPISNIVAIIIVAITMLATNFSINYIMGYFTPSKMLDTLQGGYLCGITSNEFDSNNLTKVDSISYGYQSTAVLNGSNIEINAYSKNFEDTAKVSLKQGSWYNQTPSPENAFNAVVTESSNCKVGDTVTAYVGINRTEITLYITGILPNKFYYYQLNLSGTPVMADSVVSLHNFEGEDLITGLCFTDLNAVESYQNKRAVYIRFGDDISAQELSQNLEYIGDYGSYFDITTVKNNSNVAVLQTVRLFLPMIILLAFLAVFATMVVSAITIIKNKKMLTVFFYCGSKNRDVAQVIFAYIFIIYIFAFSVYGIVNFIINSLKSFIGSYIPLATSFWVVAVVMLLLIVSTSVLYGLKSSKNIAMSIKEE